MEGMTNLQKQIMEKDKDKDAETVRSQIELPPLPPWSSTTGPVDLSDWLVLIEPMMADLTATSSEWWSCLIDECQAWYSKHLQLQPLDRVAHEPAPSSTLTVSKWLRLERRASTLLLMAVPSDQREELISAKRLTAMKIVCHLMVLYQPGGGLAEKELILKQLESPPETASLSEALQGLRKWSRWRNRATDLGAQEPDPFLLLKGLNRLTRKPLEQHRDLSFRISLARSTLQVDATPTSRTITSFLLHLIAEFEQVVHSEATHSKKKDTPDPKAKTFKPDFGGQRDRNSGGDQGEKKEVPPCRFFLTVQVVEKAVDADSTMTSKMRRGVAITVDVLTTWHLNVIKGMEVDFDRRPVRVREIQTRMNHHRLDLNLKFNQMPARNQCLQSLKRQTDFWRLWVVRRTQKLQLRQANLWPLLPQLWLLIKIEKIWWRNFNNNSMLFGKKPWESLWVACLVVEWRAWSTVVPLTLFDLFDLRMTRHCVKRWM